MAVIESAWESHPGYRIDLVPYRGVARAWHGDLLLAESTAALRVIETDHVERLYFPESDVRLELFAPNDHHTICPFKGEADYWTLTAADPAVEEDWKWNIPVWKHDGMICTGETYKSHVKVTFAKGASLADPSHLFTQPGSVRSAIDLNEGDALKEPAFKALVKAAVALNQSPGRAAAKPSAKAKKR